MEKRVKSILPKPSVSPSQPAPLAPKRRSTVSGGGSEIKRRNSSIGQSEARDSPIKQSAGHRPVTSCTFCRQHKIKCNASENYPNPCSRCEKMNLKCEIDPKFRPKKGSQIKSLMSDVDELKSKIEMLTKNESLLTQAINQHNLNYLQQSQQQSNFFPRSVNSTPIQRPTLLPNISSPQILLDTENTVNLSNNASAPATVTGDYSPASHSHKPQTNLTGATLNDSMTTGTLAGFANPLQNQSSIDNSPDEDYSQKFPVINEFVLGSVHLPLSKADELHAIFTTKYLPFMPIFSTTSATSLYHKSQLLFWSCMLTAALSEPEPSLYMSLAVLIKQLAIETCWIHTPRSTHVIQALVILSIWPLPNEKVLDDCSYRFIGLAKKLSLQLGLHRGGEFINEFSRTQVSLGPNAERWRTRTWLAVFFCEQFWSSVLGLPPSVTSTDYLVESARVDTTLPTNFRCLISLSVFQCKLVSVMGVSVTSPDGLLEPSNRAGSLNILDRELERLRFKLPIGDGSSIEVYFLYLKLMICCFAFLPGTPIEDQVKYVSYAYLASTRIITLTSQMISNNTVLLIELPIYVRQAITYSVLILFKLQLSRYLIDKYVDSARQSIVTVHRLMRNTLSSWKDLQNDISRTARLLENLNVVLFSYPEIFLNGANENGASIISRMRSHLTASLFYDLVWCVHEARRRNLINKNQPQKETNISLTKEQEFDFRKPVPLPFYNQITKDDFKTITTTTPNGTTITTLVPTDEALNQAKSNANASGSKEPLAINGIPLSMLEATGSMNENKNHEVSIMPDLSQPSNSQIGDMPTPTMNMGASPLFIHDSTLAPTPMGQQVPYSNSNIQNAYKFTNDSEFNDPNNNSNNSDNNNNKDNNNNSNSNSNSNNNNNNNNNINDSNNSMNRLSNVNNASTNNDYTNNSLNQIPTQDHMVSILQQQSDGWLHNDNYEDDDFLGWFDMTTMPKQG